MNVAYAGSIIALIAAGIWLSIRADRNAAHRRADRLRLRDPAPFTQWQSSFPNIPKNSLNEITELIAGVLQVPVDRLRPGDSFQNELVLADRFFCLVIDDDTTEEICDAAEERYGARPRGDWYSLQDAVLGIWPLLPSDNDEEDRIMA